MKPRSSSASENPSGSDKTHQELQRVFRRFSGDEGDLIPILQDIQSSLGYLPREAMLETARFLRIPEAFLYGVVTFYAQFHLTRQGRHRIKCCTGTACHVRGSKQNLVAIRKKLGLEPGQTSPDYEFTLERIACLGSCALAPVVILDDKVHGEVTPVRMDTLLDAVRERRPPGGEDKNN